MKTIDETPVRQLGVEIDTRLHKRFGDIGDSFTLIGLAYLEGLDARKKTERANIQANGRETAEEN
jgi:hypothetical protein